MQMRTPHFFATAGVAIIITSFAAVVVPATASAGFSLLPGAEGFDGSLTEAPPAQAPPGTVGAVDTQAGSHPFAITTTVGFASHIGIANDEEEAEVPNGDVKDIEVELPPGLVGSPAAVPRCTRAEFNSFSGEDTACPDSTQIGVVKIHFSIRHGIPDEYPVFNLVPYPGVPAQFGFDAKGIATVFDGAVRPDSALSEEGGYTAWAVTKNTPQLFAIVGSSLTLWGVPADAGHDAERVCTGSISLTTGCPSDAAPKSFLTLPTRCSPAPLQTRLFADSWQEPGAFNGEGGPDLGLPGWQEGSFSSHEPGGAPVGVYGCNRLAFSPQISLQPDVSTAGAPSGYEIKLSVPQSESGSGLAEADLENAVMAFPAGLIVNPAAANGLQSCTEAEIGLGSTAEQTCPAASKIGSVVVHTPALEKPLGGAVYLAQQGVNPFHSLIAVYIVVEGEGVRVKLAGHVEVDGQTGQITTIVPNDPQFPFNELSLHLFGGPRAALVNPSTCGVYTTTTSLAPWSEPESGLPATPFDSSRSTRVAANLSHSIRRSTPGSPFLSPEGSRRSRSPSHAAKTNRTSPVSRPPWRPDCSGCSPRSRSAANHRRHRAPARRPRGSAR